jgi:hypothetical protein
VASVPVAIRSGESHGGDRASRMAPAHCRNAPASGSAAGGKPAVDQASVLCRRPRRLVRCLPHLDLGVAFAGSRRPSCRCRSSINSPLAMSVPPGGTAARSVASSMTPDQLTRSPQLREG